MNLEHAWLKCAYIKTYDIRVCHVTTERVVGHFNSGLCGRQRGEEFWGGSGVLAAVEEGVFGQLKLNLSKLSTAR